MGRTVGSTSAHTKKRSVHPSVKVPVKTNTSRHPRVYRPTPNYTTSVNKQGLSNTQGVHGASYGVTQHQQARVIQQQQRTRTVNLAHKVRHVIGGGGVSKPHVPVTVKTTQAKQHQVATANQGRTSIVYKGNKKFIKKKIIRPKGAGQHPVYMNPFGLL